MKLIVVSFVLFHLCANVSAIGNRWTRKREEKEEENGFDNLIKLKNQNEQIGEAAPSMDDILDLFKAGSEDGFDISKIISESLDATVEFLSDPEQRKLIDRDTVESFISQLPPEVKNTPEMSALLNQSLEALEKIDPEEYQKQIDLILDGMLEYTKGVQKMLQNPEDFQKILSETMDSLGISKDFVELMNLLSDPEALQNTMESIKDFNFSENELNDLAGNGDFSGMFGNQLEAMTKALMEDPELMAAMKDPQYKDIFEDLMKDPEFIEAMAENKSKVKTAR
mmetsp:Transcript_16482/g.23262  ORF Transcript_16482/g.23262 Transcript_16482/m.23262 type:complete len:282 (-) Transcript_16482:3-848(-)